MRPKPNYNPKNGRQYSHPRPLNLPCDAKERYLGMATLTAILPMLAIRQSLVTGRKGRKYKSRMLDHFSFFSLNFQFGAPLHIPLSQRDIRGQRFAETRRPVS